MHGPYIEILNEQGNRTTESYQEAIKRTQQRVAQEDRRIGLHRPQIPVRMIYLPDVPAAADYTRLADAIEQLSTLDAHTIRRDQALMLRCFRCYWNAKAILFPNLLYKLLSDLTADGAIFSQILPPPALENLRIELAADKALYDLLYYDLRDPEQSAIRAWLEKEKIEFPFVNHEDYFLSILSIHCQRDYQAVIEVSDDSWETKREQQAFHRQCWKYLSNAYDPDEDAKKIQMSEAALRNSEWEGYALLALRTSPKQGSCKTFKRLWQRYLKTQRTTLKLLDSDLHWQNAIPHKRKTTNDIYPIEGDLTDEGYIYWFWGEPPSKTPNSR